MQKLILEFVSFDEDRMRDAIERARSSVPAFRELKKASSVCLSTLRYGYEANMDVPPAWWWIMASKFLMPDIVLDPWFQLKWWLFEQSRGQRKTNTFWGCANSGKTDWFGVSSLVAMAVWPGRTHVYITAPWETHSVDKVWLALRKQIEPWKVKIPGCLEELGMGFVEKEKLITIYEKETRLNSEASLISLQNAAAAQGAKSRARHDSDPRLSLNYFICDEFIENPGIKLREVIANNTSVDNFMGMLGCNPKPERVRHPALRGFSEPVEIRVDALMKKHHAVWKTAYGTLVRFHWGNCPNRFRRDPYFKYLINEISEEAIRKQGVDLADHQVDAWGWGHEGSGCELTIIDSVRPEVQGTPVWQNQPQAVMAVDPAFGGNDPASYTILDFGKAMIERGDGTNVVQDSLCGRIQEKFEVEGEFRPNAQWVSDFLARAEAAGAKKAAILQAESFKPGALVNSSWWLVDHVLRLCHRHNVPPNNICFDSSMRPDCAKAFDRTFPGMAWNYDGMRTMKDEEALTKAWFRFPFKMRQEKEGTAEPMLWSDEVSDSMSMIWRLTERLIAGGHVVGVERLKLGIDDIMSRPWETKPSGRVVLCDKKTLIRKYKVCSPTLGETLSMAIYLAVRFKGALPDLFKIANTSLGGVAVTDWSVYSTPGFRGIRHVRPRPWQVATRTI